MSTVAQLGAYPAGGRVSLADLFPPGPLLGHAPPAAPVQVPYFCQELWGGTSPVALEATHHHESIPTTSLCSLLKPFSKHPSFSKTLIDCVAFLSSRSDR
ncbi:hypothetical protein Forpe1208_v005624 [Fusarium oxysporum f. sp. rapae]|uniref:Uncharacterized protein n=1 Tax=Fusarium oxysporum f. sp. rapae TaxID=485398 RepID=A0A8J5P1C5_FUSOX|nr:hypothetical protein Forpe1208_v005624 [Fusarium oxysporum f. sp. rapae]